MGRPPLKHYQVEAISYAVKNPYSILALDPGLGKSRCAIEVRQWSQANCLIVCPSYLVLNWEKEIKKWSGRPADVTKFRKGADIYEVCDTDYVVISYDLAKKAEHLFEWASMVVLDEGHALKSMKAKRTEFMHRAIYEWSVPRLHILTGTPIKNRVQEFYSLLALMYYNPHGAHSDFLDRWPSEIDFADHFSNREQFQMRVGKGRRRFKINVVKWSGLRNVKQLRRYLEGRYLRIKAEDVLDLPPVLYKEALISKTPDPELIEAFNSHFEVEGADTVKPDAKKNAALKKVPFTIKYVESLLDEVECCLVYSDHVASAEAIAQKFGVRAITGKVSASVRSQIADDFQKGQGRILVATIGSMKEGKDLYRASDLVFNDYGWVPGDITQVIRRINRLGQTKRCTVHRILGSPQDEYIMETIDDKMEVIRRAT